VSRPVCSRCGQPVSDHWTDECQPVDSDPAASDESGERGQEDDLPPLPPDVGAIPGAVVLAAVEALDKVADEYDAQPYIRRLPEQTDGQMIAAVIRFDVLRYLRELLAVDPADPVEVVG